MAENLNFISKTIAFLQDTKLLSSINPLQIYHDEPKISYYSAIVQTKLLPHFFNSHDYLIQGIGYSFTSKEVALAKCLGETLERMSLFSYDPGSLTKLRNKKITSPLLNPSLYPNFVELRSTALSYTEGYDLSNNQKCLIPAQLIYLPYAKENDEPPLTENNSTGAAGGFDISSTLLSGIYEVVERDAFLTMFLGSILPPRIEPTSVTSQELNIILNTLQRYNLEYFLFDITNDLSIPSYMSIIVDRGGIGPAIRVGLKAGVEQERAIIGSLEEAFVARQWIRKEMQTTIEPVHANMVTSSRERGLYWADLEQLHNISSWLKQRPQPFKKIPSPPKKMQLSNISKKLQKRGHTIYYKDITPHFIQKIPYLIYKIVIPTLQPFYTSESNKELRRQRLEQVRNFYAQSNSINNLPHPLI